jgi:Ion transport protein
MIPFSLIFQNVKDVLFIVNFLRILRLVKILPLYRVLNFLKRYNVNLVRLVEIILAYYVVAHIVAGVMLSVGLAHKDKIEDTWMNKIPVPLPSDVPKQTNIDTVDFSTLYIHAIYFSANTISHVAIGDLTSVSTNERALNAFIIWCLTFFYALLFANISSVFSGSNNFLSFN